MKISSIVATSLNNAIGKNNQLLWHLPADLKFFKTTTMGCPVVMGRKTFQSIGRVLPGRKNVVITRDTSFNSNHEFDILIASSLQDAFKLLANESQIFITGGGEIYKKSMDLIDSIYLTKVHTTIDGDVYFPVINLQQFQLVWEEAHQADEKNLYDYTFQKYERIK
ncbi:MAG: dihydrofolate reductase [Bacteroidia bacterium]|nr:dihydrofolate reductase [Bacteroidia bacterium]